MDRRHYFYRRPGKNPHTMVSPSIEHHLAKRCHVRSCRVYSECRTRIPRSFGIEIAIGLSQRAVPKNVPGCSPSLFPRRREEKAVLHSERFEDPSVDKSFERLFGYHVDNAAQSYEAWLPVRPLGGVAPLQWTVNGLVIRPKTCCRGGTLMP